MMCVSPRRGKTRLAYAPCNRRMARNASNRISGEPPWVGIGVDGGFFNGVPCMLPHRAGYPRLSTMLGNACHRVRNLGSLFATQTCRLTRYGHTPLVTRSGRVKQQKDMVLEIAVDFPRSSGNPTGGGKQALNATSQTRTYTSNLPQPLQAEQTIGQTRRLTVRSIRYRPIKNMLQHTL